MPLAVAPSIADSREDRGGGLVPPTSDLSPPQANKKPEAPAHLPQQTGASQLTEESTDDPTN